jgi:hypothetical protein
LLAYPGPNVSPDALRRRGETDGNKVFHAPLVPAPSVPSLLKTPEAQT